MVNFRIHALCMVKFFAVYGSVIDEKYLCVKTLFLQKLAFGHRVGIITAFLFCCCSLLESQNCYSKRTYLGQ